MEIPLPLNQEFIDKLLAGETNTLFMPKTALKAGDSVTASVPYLQSGRIRLGIQAVEYRLLHSVTAEEAEKAGYVSPEFCPSKDICENIETRIDLESLVFKRNAQEEGVRSPEEREKELYRRLEEGCRSCALKKDSKDLFLHWWESIYQVEDNQEISKIEFEIIALG